MSKQDFFYYLFLLLFCVSLIILLYQYYIIEVSACTKEPFVYGAKTLLEQNKKSSMITGEVTLYYEKSYPIRILFDDKNTSLIIRKETPLIPGGLKE